MKLISVWRKEHFMIFAWELAMSIVALVWIPNDRECPNIALTSISQSSLANCEYDLGCVYHNELLNVSSHVLLVASGPIY